jgi:hypothetical protein
MKTRTLGAVVAGLLVAVGPAAALAQVRPGAPPPAQPGARVGATADAAEIKLDESTALKAAALDARISALLANFALLQRQAQDMQQEMNKMLEERKALVTDAARRVNVSVQDPNEWVFDNKGQRYMKVQRPAPPASR